MATDGGDMIEDDPGIGPGRVEISGEVNYVVSSRQWRISGRLAEMSALG